MNIRFDIQPKVLLFGNFFVRLFISKDSNLKLNLNGINFVKKTWICNLKLFFCFILHILTALDEDIGTRVKISVNSDKHDPDTEECLIYDRKLQARIKKAAVGQKNEDMVKQIFEKNDRNLSMIARVYRGVPKNS